MSARLRGDDDQAQMPGASSAGGDASVRRRAPGVGALIALAAGCAVIFCVWRASWDQDQPLETAVRGLDSGDPARRSEAIREVSELGFRQPGEPIRLLIPVLKDREAGVRKAAVDSLGLLGANAIGVGDSPDEARATTAALLELTRDPDDRVRAAVAMALAGIVSTAARPGARIPIVATKAAPSALDIDCEAVSAVLAGALTAPDESLRQAAIIGLGAVAPRVSGGPPPALIRALDDGSVTIRAAAAAALGHYAHGLDPAIPPLIRHLEDEEPHARSACAEALRAIRPPAVSPAVAPAVLAALRVSDHTARASLVMLLGRLKPDPGAAVPVLLAILREAADPGVPAAGPDRGVAESGPNPGDAAAEALGRVAPGTPRAAEVMAALLEIVRSGPPRRRAAAAEALGDFGPAAVAAAPVLIGLAKEARSIEAVTPASDEATVALGRTSLAAIRALGKIAPGTPAADEALSAVIEALRAPWVGTRWQALRALPAFGPKAAAVLPAIRELRDRDTASLVRQAASEALSKIEARSSD
jgi:HEAT repeat protein